MGERDGSSVRRTALFVDFENVFIGLRNSSPEAARRFATDPTRWVRWMEQDLGPLLVDDSEFPRTLLRRICYLDPATSRQYRSYFTRAGFRVVDCPSLTAMGKNSADIHMVLDIVDTLAHPTHFDEFIVLSADADFTPVLLRLREHDRRTAMLVNGPTAVALQAACDFAIPDTMFIEEALGLDGQPTEEPAEEPVMAQRMVDRPDDSLAGLRARMERAVRDLVNASPVPVDMATAAHRVRKAMGGTAATNGWAGAATFKQFIATIQDDTLVIDPAPPGWLRDPTRHEPVNNNKTPPEGVPEVATLVHRVVGAPLLTSPAYTVLFEAIAAEGRSGANRSPADAERAVRLGCTQRGHTVSRHAVHFVLVGFHYSRVVWQSPDATGQDLAGRFADNVLRLAGNAQMDLTDKERDQIQDWINQRRSG